MFSTRLGYRFAFIGCSEVDPLKNPHLKDKEGDL